MRAAVLAFLVLAGCAETPGAPGSMCLINCTIVVRTDSAGDDSITQSRHRHIDDDTRKRALEWMGRDVPRETKRSRP